eukprot:1157259-Pelagomonas_calceolata.AAC.18
MAVIQVFYWNRSMRDFARGHSHDVESGCESSKIPKLCIEECMHAFVTVFRKAPSLALQQRGCT